MLKIMSKSYEADPGAATESMLVATDSCENFEKTSSSLEEIKHLLSVNSDEESIEIERTDSNLVQNVRPKSPTCDADDVVNSKRWLSNEKHVFVLSMAGKPIYSRHGNEDKLAWLFGVMQTLVNFVQMNDDNIKYIRSGSTLFVFLVKKPLILVAVSRTNESANQLTEQLNYVFNQIASVLTATMLNKIFDQKQNYDLRKLLTGAERLIDHLLNFTEKEPAFTMRSIECLPLASSVRHSISTAIIQSCSKMKKLVFAILLAKNQLITLVRMKKYYIHAADLHLIFNLVQASESLKAGESWTPLCLPRFDGAGFLYGHVSYLAEDCQACLLLLTIDRDMFYVLSEAKQKIVEKLRRGNCLEAINESLGSRNEVCAAVGFPDLRHYLYKCKSTSQFYQPGLSPPYNKNSDCLGSLYKRAHQFLHDPQRPIKLLFEKTGEESILAWNTVGFELYAVFEPVVEIPAAITTISNLLSWIKKREDKLFHLDAPTF